MKERKAPGVRLTRPGAVETNRSRKQSVSFDPHDKPWDYSLTRIWTTTISVRRKPSLPVYHYSVSLTDGRTTATLYGEVPALDPLAGTEATLRAVAAAQEWLSHLPPQLVGRISIRAAADSWSFGAGRRGAL